MRHATYIHPQATTIMLIHPPTHTHIHARLSFRNYIPTYIHTTLRITDTPGSRPAFSSPYHTITSHHITLTNYAAISYLTSHQPHTNLINHLSHLISIQSNPVPLRTTTARRSAFPAPPPFAGGSYDTLFFFFSSFLSSSLLILACFIYVQVYFLRVYLPYLSFYIRTYS